MDIIQSALQQSSLSCSLEDSNDTYTPDLSDTTPSFMDSESVALPTCSSPLSEENIPEEVSLEAIDVEDVIHVLHLWNRVAESTR